MTDPALDKPDQTDKVVQHYLSIRQFGIGLAIESERMLESLGHPVESAVVTRRERRKHDRTKNRRNG